MRICFPVFLILVFTFLVITDVVLSCGDVEGGVDYFGNTLIRSTNIASHSDCCSICGNDVACKYWTYNRQTKICFLKSSDSGRRTGVSVAVSGTSDCGKVERNVDYFGNTLRRQNNVRSFSDCCRICGSDSSCGYWTYNTQTKICFLKTSDSDRRTDVSVGISGTPNKGNCEKVEKSVDYLGNTVRRHNNIGSHSDCCRFCGNDLSCRFWTYNTETRICFLKSSDAGRRTNIAVAISGAPNKDCGKIERNVDYFGNTLRRQNNVASFSDCCRFCGNDGSCKFWTYNPETRICFLKSSDFGRRTNKIAISGTPRNSVGHQCQKHDNMDSVGANLAVRNNQQEGACCSICAETPDCHSYAWNNHQGGTCWLKRTAQLIHKPGVKAAIVAGSESNILRVMSYNIRYENDGDNRKGLGWNRRKTMVTSLIRKQSPQVFGIQEALAGQLGYLANSFPQYGWYGIRSSSGEHLPIFWDIRTFSKVQSGSFWMSETPNVPGKGWDAALARICGWVHLRHKVSGSDLFVFNNHYDHAGVRARVESAKLSITKIREIARDRDFVLMGDLNANPSTDAIRTLNQSPLMKDARSSAQFGFIGPLGTFNGFRSEADPEDDELIDFVFVGQDMRVLKHAHLNDRVDGIFPSDHLPLVSDFEWS